MKVWILIWDYFPGQEGGSERQARLITKSLNHQAISCEVITAWTHFSMSFNDLDENATIKRFGHLAPLRLIALKATRLIFNALFFLIARYTRFSVEKYLKFQKKCEFWLQLPWTFISRLSFILHLFLYIRLNKQHVDIIHLHEPSWLGGVAYFLSNYTGSSVICQEATSPALPTLGYDVPFRGLIARLRLLPNYIAMAQYTKVDLLSKGISEDRIYLLPNGVKIPEQVSRRIENQALYVGNLSQGADWKGFDILFDAWCHVVKKKPEAHLRVIGGGDITPWLLFLKKNKCEQSVTFIGRIDDPDRFYKDASLFILPSRVEGMSNALLEAQSWGIPAVVSDIPGNMAVVTHKENGLVVPVGDSIALAENVLELLGNDLLKEEMGRNARKRAEEQYDILVVTQQLLSIYMNCLDKKAILA